MVFDMLFIILRGSYHHYPFHVSMFLAVHGKGGVRCLGLVVNPSSYAFLSLQRVCLVHYKVFLVAYYGGFFGLRFGLDAWYVVMWITYHISRTNVF